MKVAFVALLIFSMILISTFLQSTMAYDAIAPTPTRAATPLASICDQKCGVRCFKAGYKERCKTFCGICCNKCKGCVPSGTIGNKSECPCYRDLLNSKGKPKCP